VRLEVTNELIREAAALADRYPLRAYDAIHLASAVIARRRLGDDLVFACWDDALSAAASREGLELAPSSALNPNRQRATPASWRPTRRA
jgi:predicted nucleic acid-binding protein